MIENILGLQGEMIPSMLKDIETKRTPTAAKISCDFSCVDEFPLSMAYVPMQQFRKVLTAEKGLASGTLFEELYLPFRGGDRL